MTKSRPHASAEFLIKHLREQLDRYLADLPHLGVRERVLRLIDLQHTFRKLGKTVVADTGFATGSARGRIRQYLLAHPDQVIEGEELGIIAGISEYARRVREVREEGIHIRTGPDINPTTGLSLRPDQYLYVKTTSREEDLFKSSSGNEEP